MDTADQFGHRSAAGRINGRRRVRVTAAAVAGVSMLAAGTLIVASSASGSAPQVRTIHIVTTSISVARNSAGLGGPGDVVAQVFSFEVSPGVTGHIAGSATIVSASEQLSHVAFVFPDGQIDAQAAISLPPTKFTAAIIGGTGAYEGVAGEVVNTVISQTPLTIDRTLFLIYPHPDR
jgi:hypothetical protein